MAVLLTALAYYLMANPTSPLYLFGKTITKKLSPKLAGENTIELLDVKKQGDGTYKAIVKYFYTGEPERAWLLVKASRLGAENEYSGTSRTIKPGQETVEIEIHYPHRTIGKTERSDSVATNVVSAAFNDSVATNAVSAALIGSANARLAVSSRSVEIVWPPLPAYYDNKAMQGKSRRQLYDEAVSMIDDGSAHSLSGAKQRLEMILRDSPRDASAHVELARIAMKSNWGPEGLLQAEQFVATALEFEPDSANAKVLQGYIFAHQKRFEEAEQALSRANALGTRNPWLWVNWGQLRVMQGDTKGGIEKYLVALREPREVGPFDRAREDGYRKLIALYEKAGLDEQLEALHKHRVADFPERPCHLAKYAEFLTMTKGDFASGAERAQSALTNGCKQDVARQALGLAQYFRWSQLTGDAAQIERTRARVSFPEGATLLQELARHERGVPVIKRLVASGLSIDQAGNSGMTALALALTEKDHTAARRLLRLGSNVNAKSVYGEYPVTLIPVMSRDIDGIKLLRQHGVDYSKVKLGGTTALEMAKQFGDAAILSAMRG